MLIGDDVRYGQGAIFHWCSLQLTATKVRIESHKVALKHFYPDRVSEPSILPGGCTWPFPLITPALSLSLSVSAHAVPEGAPHLRQEAAALEALAALEARPPNR